jgi:hypothetical protein
MQAAGPDTSMSVSQQTDRFLGLFANRRRYAEAAGKPWVIFSVEHGRTRLRL